MDTPKSQWKAEVKCVDFRTILGLIRHENHYSSQGCFTKTYSNTSVKVFELIIKTIATLNL